MNNNFSKTITNEEELRLEGVLKLLPCQKAIKFHPDNYDGIGVEGCCEIGNVSFYSKIYMSKYIITETCKNKCQYCQS